MSDLKNAIEHYSKLHQDSPQIFSGQNFLTSLSSIRKLAEYTGKHPGRAQPRILDFGCGKGLQYQQHEYWANGKCYPGLSQALLDATMVPYDPCVPQFAEWPTSTFDGIIAVDVLNSIPLTELNGQLTKLFGQLHPHGWFYARTTLADSKKAINDPYWKQHGRTVSDYLTSMLAHSNDHHKLVLEVQLSHTGRQDWGTWYRLPASPGWQWEFFNGLFSDAEC